MISLDRFPLHYLAAFRAAAQTENLRAAAREPAPDAQRRQPADPRAGRRSSASSCSHARAGAWQVEPRPARPCNAACQQGLRRACRPGLLAASAGPQQHGTDAARDLTALLRTALADAAAAALAGACSPASRWTCIHRGTKIVDLEREGYQIGLRVGRGSPGPALINEPPLPFAADRRRRAGAGAPPRDRASLWSCVGLSSHCWATWTCGSEWFAEVGHSACRCRHRSSSTSFNDAGVLGAGGRARHGRGAGTRADRRRRTAGRPPRACWRRTRMDDRRRARLPRRLSRRRCAATRPCAPSATGCTPKIAALQQRLNEAPGPD